MSFVAIAGRLAAEGDEETEEDLPLGQDTIPPTEEAPEEAPQEPPKEVFEGVLEPLDAIKYVVQHGQRRNEWCEAALYGVVMDILGGMRTDQASLDQAIEYANNE